MPFTPADNSAKTATAVPRVALTSDPAEAAPAAVSDEEMAAILDADLPPLSKEQLRSLTENPILSQLVNTIMKDGKKAWDTSLGGGGGGGRGRGGYGSIVDVGDALLALTPAGDLIVFEPGEKEYKQIAKYSVGKSTYAYPIASGKRIFIKDSDSVAMYLVGE